MDELAIKNETIQSLDLSSYGVNAVVSKLEELYSKKYSNIADIYRAKMYEFEDIFKNKGMLFYKNTLGMIILRHFDSILLEGCNLINDISQNVSDLTDSYLVSKIMLFLNKMPISDYQKLCSKFSSFSLQSDIKVLLINYFKASIFYLYKPGEFTNKYEEIKEILVKLDINIDGLDKDILPIIKRKEQEILVLYECAKSEINSDNEDDIQNYISTMVQEFQNELNGKQKKHI